MNKKCLADLLPNGHNSNRLRMLFNVVENAKPANSQFPFGELIWAQALSIS